MKKLLALLSLLVATLVCRADSPSSAIILNGQATNTTIYWGTNRTPAIVLNRLASTTSFTTISTNLAFIVTNITPLIPSTQIGVTAGFFAATPATNQYFFNASYDKIHWDALTNVSVYGPGGALSYSNFTLTLGNYQYVQVANITNWLGITSSNFLGIYHK